MRRLPRRSCTLPLPHELTLPGEAELGRPDRDEIALAQCPLAFDHLTIDPRSTPPSGMGNDKASGGLTDVEGDSADKKAMKLNVSLGAFAPNRDPFGQGDALGRSATSKPHEVRCQRTLCLCPPRGGVRGDDDGLL